MRNVKMTANEITLIFGLMIKFFDSLMVSCRVPSMNHLFYVLCFKFRRECSYW